MRIMNVNLLTGLLAGVVDSPPYFPLMKVPLSLFMSHCVPPITCK